MTLLLIALVNLPAVALGLVALLTGVRREAGRHKASVVIGSATIAAAVLCAAIELLLFFS